MEIYVNFGAGKLVMKEGNIRVEIFIEVRRGYVSVGADTWQEKLVSSCQMDAYCTLLFLHTLGLRIGGN